MPYLGAPGSSISKVAYNGRPEEPSGSGALILRDPETLGPWGSMVLSLRGMDATPEVVELESEIAHEDGPWKEMLSEGLDDEERSMVVKSMERHIRYYGSAVEGRRTGS